MADSASFVLQVVFQYSQDSIFYTKNLVWSQNELIDITLYHPIPNFSHDHIIPHININIHCHVQRDDM